MRLLAYMLRAGRRAALPVLLVLAAAPLTAPLAAQAPEDDSVATRLRGSGVRIDTPRAVIWADSGALGDAELRAFAERFSAGVDAIERLLGARLDTAHYAEDSIHVFLARDVTVSHVYGGYLHQRYDRPYLYLGADKVRAGEAPWLHEATHLVAWRFGSHSLREGLASWVETVLAERGVAPGAALFGVTSTARADELAQAALDGAAGQRALPWIGRAGFPPGAVTEATRANRPTRAAYYVLSQSFVQHLVRATDVATVLRLYAAADAEEAYLALTGRTREAWVQSWLGFLQP